MTNNMLIGGGEENAYLLPAMASRHGLITGATGTGKTITLKVLCEAFSDIGTPVFVVDAKGDVASLSQPGELNEKITERCVKIGIPDFTPKAYPVALWDVYGEQGCSLRTTVSEMGPLLLSRLLNLNDIQSGVMNVAFKVADEQGLLLIDLKDLRALLNHVNEESAIISEQYGKISSASVGAILRNLLVLEEQGGSVFFGEPALELPDLLRVADGKGVINVLAADKLMLAPALYASVLLWLLSELYEELPEIGEMAQPKLVLFFDEAHMIFKDTPRVLLDQIEQVVRLIRSKGVGVYFISQSPLDIPEPVLAQLGNRIQHALRAYTPKEQKNLKAVADSFRANPDLNVAEAISALPTGDALVSLLDEKGIPGMTRLVHISPPHSFIGTVTEGQRLDLMNQNTLREKYQTPVDRESAFERLQTRAVQKAFAETQQAEQAEVEKATKKAAQAKARQSSSPVEKATKSFVSSLSRTVGREIARGLLGSIRKPR